MKKFKLIIISVFLLSLAGCWKDYDVPEIVEITPSQTAYLIPLVGKTSDQKAFGSEEMLEKNKVATKQVQIPHRWIDTGRMPGAGEWIGAAKLIVVERKPVTRMWTESPATGTSTKDDGIGAESKGSISFIARMNCVAQIDETDATKFLYRYNNKPLEQIMDEEIKARVESKFVEAASKRRMEEILTQKQEIMNEVRGDVLPYFSEKGISITVLGLKGDLTYLDPAIQESINAEFKSVKLAAAQAIDNQKNIDIAKAEAFSAVAKAKGKAESEMITAKATAAANNMVNKSLTKELVTYESVKKWDGKLPQVSGQATPFINIK